MPQLAPSFDDPPVSIRQKLSGFWASLMFCFVYGDYLGLYVPGKVAEMNAGRMGPLGEITIGIHVSVAVMMAIPSVMVALSLLLPPVLRWLHVLLAVAYAVIILLTMIGGAPAFYNLLGGIEIILLLAILWTAIRWPRVTAVRP
jgi:hypothetical protein